MLRYLAGITASGLGARAIELGCLSGESAVRSRVVRSKFLGSGGVFCSPLGIGDRRGGGVGQGAGERGSGL